MEFTDEIQQTAADPEAEYQEAFRDEDCAPVRKSRLEWILAALALLSAVILGMTMVLCLPHIRSEMEAQRQPPTAPATISLPEPTVPQQEDEDPLALKATEPEETVPATEPVIEPDSNPYGRLDFQYNRNNYLYCLQQRSYPGVDVSAFQGNIDWQQVKDSGIRFAMLRLGYRGYESGKLVKDEYIDQNLQNTKDVGMPIGAYFFSQALTIQEVDEEIAFMLEILGDYEIQMPVVMDWEIPAGDKVRTKNMDAETLTALLDYFCKTMTEKGFTPMIYFNWHQSNNLIHLNELERYPFWLALYSDRMIFPYHVEMWQYTSTGRVPGIQGDVDINVYMPPEK